MVLHTNSLKGFQKDISPVEMIKETVNNSTKKKKTFLKITYIKIKVFFWNLSPFHWYDGFKEIRVDMNEFTSPKNKNTQK